VNSIRLSSWIAQPSPHPELGWELVPGVSGYVKLASWRTNDAGLRDRSYPVEKPAGTFRVAVVGSSWSVGPGVEIEDMYHSLLERRLAGGAPERCEFINFAVGAYGASQILASLELKALRYEPDLILFTTTQRSAPGMLQTAAVPPRSLVPQPKTYPVLRSFLVEMLISRAGFGPEPGFGWDLRVGVLERAYMWLIDEQPKVTDSGTGAAGEQSHLFREDLGAPRPDGPSVLQRLAALSASTGVPVLLVRLETHPVALTPADLRVERQAEALGLHFLDTRAAFRGIPPQYLRIYEMNIHPNAAAHEIFARVIEKELRSSGLLGGGCAG
jgi:hypothetical protein